MQNNRAKHLMQYDIFLYALGYLLCYIPLTLLSRLSGLGFFKSLMGEKINGFTMLPLYTLGSLFFMAGFFILSGWYKKIPFVKTYGVIYPKIPFYIWLSGLCVMGQIISTLWVYAFSGIGLVFAILLMKGGTMLLAPLVDFLIKKNKRKIYWPTWIAISLTLLAFGVSFLDHSNPSLNLECRLIIFFYLTSYFFKLIIMSYWAKTKDHEVRKNYIIQEQTVIMMIMLLLIPLLGLLGTIYNHNHMLNEIYRGFTLLPQLGFILEPMIIGALGTATGLFASHVFLDRRENTFCLTALQSSSLIAGCIAAIFLALFFNQEFPTVNKYMAVALVILAISFLRLRKKVETIFESKKYGTISN